ncbi:MAG: PKD domain-containing protein, partial [Bacteroidales bacterium]
MKQLAKLILVFFVVFSAGISFAQIDQGGKPLSFEVKTLSDDVDHVFVNPPDIEKARKEHNYLEKNGEVYRVAVVMDVDFNMQNAGTWDILEDGTKIWRLRITSEDAKALSLHYNKFSLPEGSSLFLYNENQAQVAGAFTALNNPGPDRRFSTRIIQGETTTLEYIQPPHVTDEPELDIYKLSYFYRGIDGLVGYYKQEKITGFGNSGDCNVNVNCPEGNNWQDEKGGVALIYMPSVGGMCTGSLVNNTAEDGTPYFLTAYHCGGDQSDQDQWEFYFNFESPDCSDPASEPSYDDIIGADMIAGGSDSGGTDFLLLELLTDPPASYGVFFNGWDRTDVAANIGIGIHHPSGDIMKISRSEALSIASWTGGMTDGHWELTWQSTTTDWSVTEGGSSGSPVFDENTKRIVGTLSGGGASCTNQSAPDYYGRFDLHWEDNGGTDSDQLAPWLDPTGSDPTNLDGYDPNAVTDPPVADFVADQTNITAGTTVQFTDLSDNTPTSWSWDFGDGGTSTDENPAHEYTSAGTYTVELTATNSAGSDTETKVDYITVNPVTDPPVADFEADLTSINIGETVNFTDLSTNSPDSWSWTFTGGDPASSTVEDPSVTYNTPGTYTVELTATNSYGSDTETKVDYITVSAAGFSMDFEDCADYSADFSPWSVYDGDGQATYGSSDCDFPGESDTMSFMAFNPSDAGFDGIADAHGGVRVGMSICPADGSESDDWLISNQLSLGDNSSFTLWALSPKPDTWGNDSYEVLVSTASNDPADFTNDISGGPVEAPDTWTEHTYDLSAYDNQDIYLAIHHVSTDKFMLWVDDMEIDTEWTEP